MPVKSDNGDPSSAKSGSEDAGSAEVIAAVDLGSNSFHMKVARVVDGQLSVIDRMRDPVRLAAGLNARKRLDDDAVEQAIESLKRFGQRLRDVPSDNVRAVGTNTLRQARDTDSFLSSAEVALGHPIQIISGREEARLIYIGVAHSTAQDQGRRLVVDIGGGSTEVIVGRRFQPLVTESLYMGCVGMSRSFFAEGVIDATRMRRAVLAARQELEHVERRFLEIGWEAAIGSSGTIRNVGEVIVNQEWSRKGITTKALSRLREAVVEAGHVDELDLPGLQPERAPVFPGGVAVLSAVFEALEIKRMTVADGALREGLLYDLIGRLGYGDVRAATIDDLCRRYRVDEAQSRRVAETAASLLDRTAAVWGLNKKSFSQLLVWAARLHEIGLDIAHSQYHRHGAYVIGNSELAGFSRQEQAEIAALVRVQRRKFAGEVFDPLPKRQRARLLRLAVLLRVAVALHRGRYDLDLEGLEVEAEADSLSLVFPPGWLDGHPLTAADLSREQAYLNGAGVSLRFE
jgi:exopolyphosphatase/guanosine-5'-triphosphate,3'-diphosphate pyrophosphatase